MNWSDLFLYLKDEGFNVFSLGQHQGKCITEYIVLRNNGIFPGPRKERREYELLLYFPIEKYSEFESYIERVKKSMNRLYPGVKLIEPETPHYLDKDVLAYMTSVTYGVITQSVTNKLF